MNQNTTRTGVIAIVDDVDALREALGSVMKAAGFVARTFASAEDFLACDDCDDTALSHPRCALAGDERH